MNKFTNYGINGDTTLIVALLEFFSITKYEVEKDRVLYKIQSPIRFKPSNLNISWGKSEQLQELAILLKAYYHEE